MWDIAFLSTKIPWRDSISRSIAPVSWMVGEDDTTIYVDHAARAICGILFKLCTTLHMYTLAGFNCTIHSASLLDI
jgi:hypothetical protein